MIIPPNSICQVHYNHLKEFSFLKPLRLCDLSSLTGDGTHAPLHWEYGVLTNRLPGRSLRSTLFNSDFGQYSDKLILRKI